MKTVKSIEGKIEKLEKALDAINRILSVPLQTPGWVVTGGANRRGLQKKLDAELERYSKNINKQQKIESDLRQLKTTLALYKEGEIHLSGQMRKDAPSKLRREKLEDHTKEFFKANYPIGSRFFLRANPSSVIVVRRYNTKTLTDTDGDTWRYNEVAPVIPE